MAVYGYLSFLAVRCVGAGTVPACESAAVPGESERERNNF